jgi:hypothetical protein
MSDRQKGFLSKYNDTVGGDTARRVPTVLVIVVIVSAPRVGSREYSVPSIVMPAEAGIQENVWNSIDSLFGLLFYDKNNFNSIIYFTSINPSESPPAPRVGSREYSVN